MNDLQIDLRDYPSANLFLRDAIIFSLSLTEKCRRAMGWTGKSGAVGGHKKVEHGGKKAAPPRQNVNR